MQREIRTSEGRMVMLPSEEENAAIQRGIDADPDAAEVPAENIQAMRPISELFEQKRIGRPPSPSPKVAVSIRYDPDVLEAFRKTGDGWQTRMNNALRVYLREHPI